MGLKISSNTTIVLLLLLSFNLNGQNIHKGFFVVDSISKTPIQSAFVQTEDTIFQTSTDENGFVNLSKLNPNNQVLTIFHIGFNTKKIDLSIVNSAQEYPVISLSEKAILLSEITLKSNASSNVFKSIGKFDLFIRPINSSQDVLRMVPGLFIGQHAGGGKAEQLFLRGFDLDHGTDINITVDGMPVNMVSHAHGQGYADLHFLIPELIQKVDFNKGPYFADKGNFATAGYVAFSTKNYLDNNFVKIEGGQFNTYRATTAINLLKPSGEKRNKSLYFAGESSFTQGYFDSPQDFNRFNGMLKYHNNLSVNNTITASVTGFASKWNASGQIPERAVQQGLIGYFGAIDNTEGGFTNRYNANIELLSNLKSGGVLRNQLYYTKYDFELYSNFTFFKEDSVNGDQIRQKESRQILGYNGAFEKEFQIGNIKTETKAGIQVRYDIINDIELSRTKNRTIVTKALKLGDIKELNIGSYWSQRFMISNTFDISTAIRMDIFSNQYFDKLSNEHLNSSSTIFSPKLNFNYWINDKIQLYLYNGSGFHSNDTRVSVIQKGKKVAPPAYGSDLGTVFKIGKKILIQSSIWYLWMDQEFVYVGDEGVVEPSGSTQRFGFDFSGRYQIVKNLFWDANFSLANPRFAQNTETENYLPLAPRFTSTGGIIFKPQQGFNGSLMYRYMGDRPANETNTVIAKGYFIIDAFLKYTQKRYEVALSIQNILNTNWKETQFETESRLKNENISVSEIHFTPGTPFFAKLSLGVYW